jgi:transcriptional regulator GlxA family with amidase domain
MDTPKTLVILLPEGDLISCSVVDAFQLLNFAIETSGSEDKLLYASHKDYFDLNDRLSIKTDLHWKELKKIDLLLVPAFMGDYQKFLAENQELIEWLRDHRKYCKRIASLCFGAGLLAAAGVLDGQPTTTHWMFADQLKAMYPEIQLKKNSIITEKDGIFTSGGAYTSLNLLIYLIEKMYGKKVAIETASVFAVDLSRSSQSEYFIFNGQKRHKNNLALQAQNYIEENYHRPINLQVLAQMASTSERTLVRHFKSSTGNTPNEYLQRVRMEKAKQFLENSKNSVKEICYAVGYNDLSTFRRTFKKYAGINPLEYRKEFAPMS